MAKMPHTIRVRLVIRNKRALAALSKVAEFLDDMEESQPWNTDAKQAGKALRYAARHIRPESEK